MPKTFEQARQLKKKNLSVHLAQSCNPAQGHWDAHGLWAIDPCPRLWISVRTMPNDVDTL